MRSFRARNSEPLHLEFCALQLTWSSCDIFSLGYVCWWCYVYAASQFMPASSLPCRLPEALQQKAWLLSSKQVKQGTYQVKAQLANSPHNRHPWYTAALPSGLSRHRRTLHLLDVSSAFMTCKHDFRAIQRCRSTLSANSFNSIAVPASCFPPRACVDSHYQSLSVPKSKYQLS